MSWLESKDSPESIGLAMTVVVREDLMSLVADHTPPDEMVQVSGCLIQQVAYRITLSPILNPFVFYVNLS